MYFLKKQKNLILIILLAASALFFNFNKPKEIVFDEIYFIDFSRSYFTGENYFDIHPPAGKLFLYGTAKIFGFDPREGEFKKIGDPHSEKNLFAMRILPAITSVLFVGLIYLFARKITGLETAALGAGLLTVFDNGIIAHSRIALLDIFLLFFGFLSLFFYFKAENKKNKIAPLFALLSGVSLGISYSVKWTGLAAAALIFFAALYNLYARGAGDKWKQVIAKLAIIFGSSFVVYAAFFAFHFSLLKNKGPGDAFLSKDFQNKFFVQKFIELNQKMYFYNSTIKSDFPFQSKWRDWPFNKKAIFYWQKDNSEAKRFTLREELFALAKELESDPQNIKSIEKEVFAAQKEIKNWDKKREIWLIGNPVARFFGILAVALGVLILILKPFLKKRVRFLDAARYDIIFFLLLGWALNYLPFAFISRPLMLYHYFLPLIFSFILFGYVFGLFAENLSSFGRPPVGWKNGKIRFAVFFTFAAVIILGFIAVAPFTYGLPFEADGFLGNIKTILIK